MKQILQNSPTRPLLSVARLTITIFLLVLIGNRAKASDYYWVGGSGDWSDYSNHWAIASGGLVFHIQIPGPLDNVYFDANSFNALGQTVTMDTTFFYCKDMDWTGAQFSPTFNAGNINIYGSLTLINNMTWFLGYLHFLATAPVTITSAGNHLNFVYFEGAGGTWSLNDDFLCGVLNLLEGTFISNNFDVEVYDFAAYNGTSTLLGTSVVTGQGDLSLSSTNLDADSADFILSGSYNSFSAGSHAYHDITFNAGNLNAGTASFHNVIFANTGVINNVNSTFHKVIFFGDASIGGNNSFDTLFFNNPGNTVVLSVSGMQTVNVALIADGTCGQPISMQSSSAGTQATINKISGTLTCSYLILKDMNATGGASFIANNSIDLGNNAGWTINTAAPRTLYWIGGTGNWSDPNHWALTSGGTGGNCVPSFTDSVFFDNNSFQQTNQTVTNDVATAYCKNMDWTGAQFSPTFNAGNINIYGSLTLINNMTWFLGYLHFLATAPVTITSAGNHLNFVYFEGAGGTWSLNDDFLCGVLNLLEGTFISNNFDVEVYDFAAYNGTSTLLGTSVVTGQGDLSLSSTNLDADSADFILSGSYNSFSAGSHAYHDITFNAGNLNAGTASFHNVIFANTGVINNVNSTFHKVIFFGDASIGGNNSFDTLFFNNPGNTVVLSVSGMQTVNVALIADGTCGQPISMQSSSAGTQATINKISGTLTCSYLILKDMNATGGASFIANNSIDLGNNAGWTINTAAPRTLYWIGGTGNWSDPNHWALTSGGTGGNCVPSFTDSVFFDNNSFQQTNQTVTNDVATAYCKNMDWTGAQFSPTFNAGNINIYGSLTLINNMTWFLGYLHFLATAPVTITSAGNHLNFVYFEGAGGTWSLNDDFLCGVLNLLEGTFISNNFDVEVYDFAAYNGTSTLLGTSVVTGQGDLSLSSTNLDADSADFILSGSYNSFSAGSHAYHDITFNAGNLNAGTASFHNVIFANTGVINNVNSTFHKVIFFGDASIGGNNSFDTLFFNNPGNTVTLGATGTQTVNDALLQNALPGFPILMQSSTAGSQATINKSSGNVCLNYFILQDINATGGAQFFAGDYSVNLGNNTGWSFTSCVPAISNVWPGDANYDLICDNLDILNIGVAYNDTGYVRPAANITWTAQPNLDWLSQFITGVNAKHADCDGNGIVNANDTLAVSLNYGLTHPARLVSPNSLSSGPELYFELPGGSLVPGSNVSVPVKLGAPANQANNVYGIAFTVNYDATLIQPGSMYLDYSTSWIATPSNFIHLEKDFSATGNFDMGLCRTNHLNVSGNGTIATLHFTVASTASGWLSLSFSDVLAISNNELPVPVNPQPSIVYTSVQEISANENFSLYPNPVTDYLYFDTKNNSFERIEIFNRLGQKVIEAASNTKKIYLGNLDAGIYLLSAFDKENKKTVNLKLVKL